MSAIPLLIIDGIIATGKTSLYNQIQLEPAYLKLPTKLLISEHITERVLEGRKPTTDDRLTLLRTTLGSIADLDQIIKNSKFAGLSQVAPHTILERFHLTHAANDTSFEPYLELESMMREIDTCLVFLYHSPEVLADRIDETRSARGAHWCAYLDSFGGREGALNHFRRLQDRSWEFYRQSTLNKVAIEAKSQPIETLSQWVADYWLGCAGATPTEAPCDLTNLSHR